ncbi:hypothetical protein [Mucilaginibacter myungsuensis]|uniref:Uncharacterized protein n=1 Tax=Mucilaginibacter myungsuensis TaxID=649104 RepID=A0A929KX57_9SPHI|nr:hypothetical protein [Mucilaginibacter myungsuensis]MBE9660300.1 hypothetical protein [Mucilaginibacter myungsuensis]MDN3600342.1 hypothetical protein [Mucilaginibacter myungsuensis]
MNSLKTPNLSSGQLLWATLICLVTILGCKQSDKTTSDSYHPLTPGTTWTYKLERDGVAGADEVISTVKDESKTFHGKTYHLIATHFKMNDSLSNDWFARTGHIYYQRELKQGTSFEDEAADESVYLDDSKPVGVEEKVFETEMPMGKTSATIELVEKGITRQVNGKDYKDVLHVRRTISLSMKMPNMGDMLGDTSIKIKGNVDGMDMGLDQTLAIDLYLAKGVGIIELGMTSNGKQLAKQTLVSYNVK